MRLNGRELLVHNSEIFTLDYHFVNKDGTPYIVPSGLNDTYFLVSVTDSKLRVDSRYIYNKWCLANYFPTFDNTTCIDAMTIYMGTPGSFSWANCVIATSNPASFRKYNSDGSFTTIYYNKTAVYYHDGEYKYYDNTNGWQPYDLELVVSFTEDITKEWSPKTYYYSITLISGDFVNDEVKIENPDTVIPMIAPTAITVLTSINGGN